MKPLRLLIYDRTCAGRHGLPGLSRAWWAGAQLYRTRGLLDGQCAAASWSEALEFLVNEQPERAVSEVQFWGHGKWGDARIDREVLDADAALRRHALNPALRRLRERLTPNALWWFRTCETLGARRGQDFARIWADFLGARVAGHTYIIGFWQSGLRALRPGEEARWDPREGVEPGSTNAPAWSAASAPNTITCFEGRGSLRRLVD